MKNGRNGARVWESIPSWDEARSKLLPASQGFCDLPLPWEGLELRVCSREVVEPP